MVQDGDLDVTQIQDRVKSGGSNSEQIVTTDTSVKTASHLCMWDASGLVVDSGVTAIGGGGGTPILDSTTHEPIVDASGNWIFAG
jgi:hypothetical protein